MDTSTKKNDPFAALRYKNFMLYIGTRFFLSMTIRMHGVIASWQIYKYTKDELALGMVGLSEVIPFIIVSFFAGHIADNYNRKTIIIISLCTLIVSTITLFGFAIDPTFYVKTGTFPLYILVGCMGIVRGFLASSMIPLMTQLVPRKLYGNASTWNISLFQSGALLGPSIAGLLCAISFSTAYGTSLVFLLIAISCIFFISPNPIEAKEKKETLKESLLAGLKFVFKKKILLNAILLDLFVVLFGGAMAMLPVYADRIYHVGASELGLISSMPALGGIATAIIIAYRPPTKNAGRNLLFSVACLGTTTIFFAFNNNYYIGLLLFLLIGAFDEVMTVTRHTIVQLSTPDHMQGRVAAVGSIFNGSSVEIGSFESGVAAKLMGLVPSVAFGGIMTLLITAITFKIAPQLRKLNLEKVLEEPLEEEQKTEPERLTV
jgi:MFS family permease